MTCKPLFSNLRSEVTQLSRLRATRGTLRVVQCMLFRGRGIGASGRWWV